MTTSRRPSLETHPRRGMLLLLVLSMLTLFALMGTVAMVIAMRSRESARAFATANTFGDGGVTIAKAMADEALLLLIRGSKDPAVNILLLRDDNLLEDKYLDPNVANEDKREDYDAFDVANPFLTHLLLDENGRIEEVHRPAFGDRHAQCTVDNDGDGVFDGVWLAQSSTTGSTSPPLLPQVTLASGNTLSFRVSYLVLDLDGRLNVNAHGKPPADQSPASDGPADLNGGQVLPSAVWSLLLTGTGGQLLTGSVSPNDQWRRPPPVGSPVDGRFGVFTGTTNQKNQLEYTYALRLDLEAPRPGSLRNATGQNPFTLGELERVLRQFDDDASTLPPRLAAILHDRAERARHRITTDSWDTPGDRYDIKWEADNSGVNDEKTVWGELWPKVRDAGAPEAAAKQWVANLLDFRDTDNAETNFDGGISGVEPGKLSPPLAGPWNDGRFHSFAELLAVPMGTKAELDAKRANNEPLISLAKQYPKILDKMMVPFFYSTLAQNPNREPGRININTCDTAVWNALLGVSDKPNPFATERHEGEGEGEEEEEEEDDVLPAKHISDVLLKVPLVFADNTYDVSTINHAIANRLGNLATVRSHVFAVWITLEVKGSAQPDKPTYHRLFAIVDRSIPLTQPFTAQSNGVTTESILRTIRLKRFLN
jgi:hypothetical protein